MREKGYGRVDQHVVELGPARQLRPVELRRGQDGPRRVHPGARQRGAQVQHPGQRHRTGRQDPHDRGAARRARPTSSNPSRSPRSWPTSPSEECDVSGEVFSAAGGLYARFFIGLTPGYYKKDADRRGRPRPLGRDPRRRRLHHPRRPERRAEEDLRHPERGQRRQGRPRRHRRLRLTRRRWRRAPSSGRRARPGRARRPRRAARRR